MKHAKKIFIPIALAAAMSLTAFLAACGDTPTPTPPPNVTTDAWHGESIWMTAEDLVPTNPAEFPEEISFTEAKAAVHDPSIFHDPVSDYYYAYGTHYAVARTYYLADAFKSASQGGWEQIAADNDYKFLYGEEEFYHSGSATKWPEALRETVELVNPSGGDPGKTTWAPDVEYINGKYYMYYSLTKAFGSNQSAIARVESDSPEGPFTNNTQIIDSMGANGATDPNCIDPELFYDKEGKLWMVYGSASAGIFIKELYTEGKNAGLPKHTKEEEGFGKLLWKRKSTGYGANEEGPFIYYNAATDYYYLMTSHASLMSTYNMHVARSKNPNGPYVGVDGKDVAVDGNGNLVAGNFKFDRSGNGRDPYAALGHNSVIKDKDGKYYIVYHARHASETGAVSAPHRLHVNQIYFNEEGWPCMAPTDYVGETRGTFTDEQVATQYEIVVHASPVSTPLVRSAVYTLAANGTVTGGNSGDSWTLKEGYYIELTLKGVTYKGVVAPGWDTYTTSTSKQKAVITISAVSNEGISLWAVQK